MRAPAGKAFVVLQVIKQAYPRGQKGTYSKEETGSEIPNRRGIEFNDCSLFCLFLLVFRTTWYHFEQCCFKKSCWWSGTSIKCAFLIVWLASWIKTRISVVRGQDKGVPGQSFWRYQLLLLSGVLFLLDAADVPTPKVAAFVLWKKTTSEKCFERLPCCLWNGHSFQHPADTANPGTGQF